MIRQFLLLCLLPTLAAAQGLTTLAPGATGGGKVLASFPLTTSGPLITEDANTVAHVYLNGTALVDTKGNSWTKNGTVPQVSANPFTTTRYGAGPFSGTNYYSMGTDVLDFAGDFTLCAVVSYAPSAGDQYIVMNGVYGAAGSGWGLYSKTNAVVILDTYAATSTYTRSATANSLATSGPNVICLGRSGDNQYVKANLGTTDVDAGSKTTAGTGIAAVIGTYTSTPWLGTIYEIYATSTPFTEATVVAIQQKVLGHFDGSSALAVTRATTATYAPRAADPSTLFTVPAGVARITDEGLLVEPARTNVVLASNTISAANAFNVNWVEWPDTTVVNVTTTTTAAPGEGVWHTITNEAGTTSNVGQAYQTVTTASSTTFVASAWMKKPTGEDTTHAGIHVGCGAGTPSACTCVRSDGGSCTASTVATNYCQALVADLSTTPVRVSAKVTCSGAITSSIVALVPGNYGSTIGITDFTGVQHEIATAEQGPSSHIVTTTTAATRNVDAISATIPSVTGLNWCLAATATRGVNAWGGTNRLWSLGTSGANTASLDLASTLTVTDAAAAAKTVATGSTPSTASHRLIACDKSGSLALSLDGTITSPGAGAGTGILGMAPTAFYFGAASASLHGGVYLKSVKLCRATKPSECK